MSDLISRDALLKALTATDKLMMFEGRLAQETGEWGIMMRQSDVIGTVMSEPSVDAAPVVHARWETYTYSNRVDTYGNPDTCAECSNCGGKWSYEQEAKRLFRYCPYCGGEDGLKRNGGMNNEEAYPDGSGTDCDGFPAGRLYTSGCGVCEPVKGS